MVRLSAASLSLILCSAAPLQAQDTQPPETEPTIPLWQHQLDEQPEVPCRELDEELTDEKLDELRADPVTDEFAFKCESDWAYIEDGLSNLLPKIGEAGYSEFERPDGIDTTIASRSFLVVYGSARIMRSVRCDFVDNPDDYLNPTPISGFARYVRFAGWTDEGDIAGDWQVSLSAFDCAFFYQTMDVSRPGTIVHNKPYDSGDTGNQILLVSGHSFTEYLDTYGNYTITLRPGISQPAGSISERVEGEQRQLLNYLTERARAEAKRRELPESLRAREED